VVIKEKIKYHQALANYFVVKSLYLDEAMKMPNNRKLVEQPFQQICGEKWDALEKTLTDLYFIEAKCSAGMTFNLVSDYKFGLDSFPEAQEEKQKELNKENRCKKYINDLIAYSEKEIQTLDIISSVEPGSDKAEFNETERFPESSSLADRLHAFSQFVSLHSHCLAKYSNYPGFTIQQAYNSSISGDVAKAAEELLEMNTFRDVLLLHEKSMRPDQNIQPAEIATLTGHAEEVKCVCISPDGKLAVSGSSDQTIRIWNIERGECLRTIEGDLGWIKCLGITADSKLALSGSTDCTLRLWNLESGQCVRILKGHTGAITTLAISPDGQLAVSGSYDNTMRLWDLNTGKYLYILQIQAVVGVCITADKRTIISAGSDDVIRIWDAGNGICLRAIQAVDCCLTSIAITPCGRYAVSGGQDKILRYWDLSGGILLREFPGHEYNITSVQISADSKIALSGSDDNTLKLWNTENGECIKTLKGHTNLITSVSMTPDGRLIVSAGDNRIRVWNTCGEEIPDEKLKHKYDVDRINITGDGRFGISSSWDRILRWNMENGTCSGEFKGHTDSVHDVKITLDGKKVISNGADETMRVWNINNGECLMTVQLKDVTVFDFEVTPDGMRVVAPSTHGFPQYVPSIVVVDLNKGKVSEKFKDHSDKINCICLSPDGKYVVSGSSDHTIKIWDLEKKRCIRTLSGHEGPILALCFAPDGQTILSSAEDSTLRIWDLNTGTCRKIFTGYGLVKKIVVTPDGRKAVFCDTDNSIKILDLQKGYCAVTYQSHEDQIRHIEITPDGTKILSFAGIFDPTIRVWDIKSGIILCVYHTNVNISSLSAILADGRFAFGSTSGEVIIMRPFNLSLGLPRITGIRQWHYGTGGLGLFNKNLQSGFWEKDITVCCYWCGLNFTVDSSILKIIQDFSVSTKINSDPASCLELQVEAWEDPRLESECPHCHSALQFNPFIVDNQNAIHNWKN
jgi:WD40 repeat protein